MRTMLVWLIVFSAGLFSELWAGENIPVVIYRATLGETDASTPEISTEQMQAALTDGKTMVFDTRSHREFAIDHIPGAINAVPEGTLPGKIFDRAAEEIDRRVQGNRTTPIVLYCNGPVCGKSRKVGDLLVRKGYTNVRRYQLGIPIWRVLQVVTESEIDGIRYVLSHDRTAVLIDARDEEAYRAGTISGARSLPLSLAGRIGKKGEIANAKKDGRLPVEDHNTRIIVFGNDGSQARALVEALRTSASFHNVSYFGGTFAQLQEALR